MLSGGSRALPFLVLAAAAAAPLAFAGCASIAGDFTTHPDGVGGDATAAETSTDDGGTGSDGADTGAGTDGSDAAPHDGSPPGDGGGKDAPGGDAPACPGMQTSCGGTCVNTMTSNGNCGACGNDCGPGSTCGGGHCSAVTLASNLATAPYGVAVAGGQVFWARPSALEKCPVTGCTSTPTQLNSDSTLTNGGVTSGTTVVTDGNYVAWLASDPNTMSAGFPGPVLYTCRVSGCNGNPQMGTATSPMQQLGLTGTTVFATLDCTGGTLKECTLGSCTGDPMMNANVANAPDECAWGVVSDGTTVYFYAGSTPGSGGVIACPITGCPSTGRVQLFQNANLLALSGSNVYATDGAGNLVVCPTTGCGGSPTTIESNQTGVTSMVADATHLYFSVPGSTSSATGEIRVCPLPGCTGGSKSVVSGEAQPVSLALGSDGFLYWANAGLPGSTATTAAIRRVKP